MTRVALVGIACLMALTGCTAPRASETRASEGRASETRASEGPSAHDQQARFATLFSTHCAGCHGADGTHGAAPPLNDSLFLALADDAYLRDVLVQGRQAYQMPSFAKHHGVTLQADDLDAIVGGIRRTWAKPIDERSSLPPLHDSKISGDASSGKKVYALACASCHGANGEGTNKGGAVNDPVYLALASDARLRRIVITGRADFGMPDYRRQVQSGTLLSSQQIADVVAHVARWRQTRSAPEGRAKSNKDSTR